ncbi:MAG TPA: Gmad2 immunoglobulin-like domain-containing protein, partial [Dermatophilaceae bacterium]|nr:Gmad2 immunoglobulin-like domain-containing protein [Dermatophilaceae bacterium]
PTSIPSSTSGASTPPTSSLTSSAGQLSGIPVYWIGESRKAFALFREFRAVPDAGGPIASAVAAMTRMTPLDPDYQTPWKPAARVTATQTGQSIAVDLSADAISNTQVGSELAARAVQQLVYTATAAAYASGTPATTVTITIDGKAADAWGVVRLGTPTQRADMASVQAHAWVTSPQEGDTVKAGKVTFTGFGTSFEANFPWKVTNAAGSIVASGATMGGTGSGGFGEVTFSATLTPGTYTVELATDDPSGGAEGAGAAVDTKRFNVT